MQRARCPARSLPLRPRGRDGIARSGAKRVSQCARRASAAACDADRHSEPRSTVDRGVAQSLGLPLPLALPLAVALPLQPLKELAIFERALGLDAPKVSIRVELVEVRIRSRRSGGRSNGRSRCLRRLATPQHESAALFRQQGGSLRDLDMKPTFHGMPALSPAHACSVPAKRKHVCALMSSALEQLRFGAVVDAHRQTRVGRAHH